MKTKTFMVALFVCVVCVSCKNHEVLPEDLPNTDTILLYEPYIPMIVPGNQWNEMVDNLSDPFFSQYAWAYVTKIGNDTVINGVTYYKLLTAEDSLSAEWKTKGFVREDTVKQEVYFKIADKPEVLLYAFRVKVGDILKSRNITWGYEISISIEAIDSLWIGNAWHKRITVRATEFMENSSYPYSKEHCWIEGIGCPDGLQSSIYAVPIPGSNIISLLCFFQNGELIYKPADTGIDDCFVWRNKYEYEIFEKHDITACGIEDPLNNIELLKKFCEEFTAETNNADASIHLWENIHTKENYFELFFYNKLDCYNHYDHFCYDGFNFYNCSSENIATGGSASSPYAYEEFIADKEKICIIWSITKK